MTYILSRDQPDSESLVYHRRTEEAWKAYRHHLATFEKRLPPGALAFARAEWHYDPTDHRCPHDAWLEWVRVEEGPGKAPVHERSTQIVVRLLGAHHDGYLEITYRDVFAYALDMPGEGNRRGPGTRAGPRKPRSHGGWLVDELRSEGHRGRAIHEIEWASGTTWIIDCGEIEATWLPEAPAGDSHESDGATGSDTAEPR